MKKGLLLGAGFSYDLGMPLASELTEIFLSLFNKDSIFIYARFLSEHKPYGEERPINFNAILEGLFEVIKFKQEKCNNYEEILSTIQNLGKNHQRTLSDKDSYAYLNSLFYSIIWNILYQYQIISYQLLFHKNKNAYKKIENIFSKNETWIFSLNHDLVIELLALEFNIPITYGDDKTINFPLSNIHPEKLNFTYSMRENYDKQVLNFFKDTRGINLVKLHGGLNEFEYKDKSLMCNLDLNGLSVDNFVTNFQKFNSMGYYYHDKKAPQGGQDMTITNNDYELDIIRKSMLTGGTKYSNTSNIKEGEEKLKVFEDILSEINELTIIGYGFGDEHINFRLSNAMVLNKNLSIKIIEPSSINIPEFLQQFNYNLRIQNSMCTATQWISYSQNKTWDYKQKQQIDDNNRIREDIKNEVMNYFKQKKDKK
ncbi:hypothetical protein [Aliarcobacter trophiarum]|uniref:hypothetical protein n=1 Tax=Aliarcobacter trophiarum TaxID=708186 RepID=UPI00100ACF21|nr:hypothetical protein [Aliarcobacter trophiarum]RXI27660.1 hypothetical protein CRU89_05120 [Aliarcobacter trophiarum]